MNLIKLLQFICLTYLFIQDRRNPPFNAFIDSLNQLLFLLWCWPNNQSALSPGSACICHCASIYL